MQWWKKNKNTSCWLWLTLAGFLTLWHVNKGLTAQLKTSLQHVVWSQQLTSNIQCPVYRLPQMCSTVCVMNKSFSWSPGWRVMSSTPSDIWFSCLKIATVMTQVPLWKVWRLELQIEALRVAQNSRSSIRCWVHAATYSLSSLETI